MTQPSKKQLAKLTQANTSKTSPKKSPVKDTTPTKVTKPKVSPVKAMKEVVAKKVSKEEIDQATKSPTTHAEHVDIAKLAYQHLHEDKPQEDTYSKPEKVKPTDVPAVEEATPSIPVHSVALAPQQVTPVKAPVATLPTTRDGKLKWSDIKAMLPTR